MNSPHHFNADPETDPALPLGRIRIHIRVKTEQSDPDPH